MTLRTVHRIVEQEVAEEVVRLLPGQCLVGLMGRQLVLHRLKQALVHDRRLFSWQHFALVTDLANEEPVAQQMGERAPAKGNAAAGVARRPERSDVFGHEVAREFVDPADLQVAA